MNAYTYLVGWSKHGKFYYGAQWNKKANPGDLWKTYFTSSNRVKKFRAKHGEPDVIQIRKTFGDDAKKCRKWEERVLMRVKKNTDAKWLNTRVSNRGWFNPTGSVVARNIVTGLVSRVTRDEFLTNPDLVGQTKGMVSATNKKTAERVYVTKTEYAVNPDLEFHTAGHVPSDETRKAASERMAGKVFAKTENGDTVHVTMEEFARRDDLSGGAYGYAHTDAAKQKITASKIGRSRPAHVGEAVGKASTGMVAALNVKTGIVSRVTAEEFRNNPDLVGASSGRVIPVDEKKRRADSTRGKTAGMVTCRDIRTGEKRKVSHEVFDRDPNLVGMRSRVPNLV